MSCRVGLAPPLLFAEALCAYVRDIFEIIDSAAESLFYIFKTIVSNNPHHFREASIYNANARTKDKTRRSRTADAIMFFRWLL